MLPITIRKRTITQDDLELIQATVKQHWDRGRTQISKILCEKWNRFIYCQQKIIVNVFSLDKFFHLVYKECDTRICIKRTSAGEPREIMGQTGNAPKGTAKKGHDHLFHGNIKDVYLYPPRKDFRERLKG